MNRRKLLQSLASVASIPFTINRVEGQALPLEKGKKYLILVKPSEDVEDVRGMARGLGELGIEGTIEFLRNPEDLKIYEVE